MNKTPKFRYLWQGLCLGIIIGFGIAILLTGKQKATAPLGIYMGVISVVCMGLAAIPMLLIEIINKSKKVNEAIKDDE